jgi:uncharacterized protein YfbU (UPF0304 family)
MNKEEAFEKISDVVNHEFLWPEKAFDEIKQIVEYVMTYESEYDELCREYDELCREHPGLYIIQVVRSDGDMHQLSESLYSYPTARHIITSEQSVHPSWVSAFECHSNGWIYRIVEHE